MKITELGEEALFKRMGMHPTIAAVAAIASLEWLKRAFILHLFVVLFRMWMRFHTRPRNQVKKKEISIQKSM